MVEVTGDVECGSPVSPCTVFAAKMHIVAMNAEMESAIEAMVKQKADAAGVMYSNADGDEAGV